MTAVEIDRKLAESLKERMAGTNVEVVQGDATKMEFADGSFSSAVCFTMLHHVPSRELQDKLLAEVYRVLRPGGVFMGTDSTTSFRFRLFHLMDTCTPIDPSGFGARLEAAGFEGVGVEHNEQYTTLTFRARKGGESES